jgi:uridine phosphorylase
VTGNAGDGDAATAFAAHLTLSFRFRSRLGGTRFGSIGGLTLSKRVFKGRKPLFERIELGAELSGRFEAAFGEHLTGFLTEPGNLGPRFLAAASESVARSLPPLRDLIDKVACAVTRFLRGRSRCRERPLDRSAKRFGYAALVAFAGRAGALGLHARSLRADAMIRAVDPYLQPTAPIAPRAILTDDPKVAMNLASALCESPRMSNLSHGLWGYCGRTTAGLDLTVQSLGIGGPSASAVMSELVGLGVERAVRIGSCVAIDPSLEPGAVIVPAEIRAHDGVGRRLCEEGTRPAPDPTMVGALVALTGGLRGTVCSVDLAGRGHVCQGALAIDLSSAAVVAMARSLGVPCACALVVSEAAGGERLATEARERQLIGLGELAHDALEPALSRSRRDLDEEAQSP